MLMVCVVTATSSSMIMRGDRMWDEVEESISQKSTRCKTKEHFEKGRVLSSIMDRDKKEDEERGCTDEGCGDEGISPQLP